MQEKIATKKSLGQHFLIAPNTIKKTVAAAQISKDDVVLEIGPGDGALTRELLTHAKKVITIEKDGELVEKLKETFKEDIQNKKLELFHNDILKCDFSTFPITNGSYKVVANIPYYITGILIRTLLTNTIQPNTVVLIVQKEIAERIAREPKESILSLSVKAYGTPKYIGTIKPGAFRPAPKVDSAIILIENISRNFFKSASEETFFKAIKAGFSSKRKQVLNNLEKIETRKKLTEVFEKLSLNQKIRAEDIGLEEWKNILSLL